MVNMTKRELMTELFKIKGNPEIAILDGFNGGGIPRRINFGPIDIIPSKEDKDSEWSQTADLEDKTETIILIGYGCY